MKNSKSVYTPLCVPTENSINPRAIAALNSKLRESVITVFHFIDAASDNVYDHTHDTLDGYFESFWHI